MQLKSVGQTPPTPRSGHSIVTVGKKNILFGGIDNSPKKNGKLYPNNQVYTIRIIGNNYEWFQQQCTGEIPLPRSNHGACAIGQDRMFIFGGYYTSDTRFNDVYFLSVRRKGREMRK